MRIYGSETFYLPFNVQNKSKFETQQKHMNKKEKPGYKNLQYEKSSTKKNENIFLYQSMKVGKPVKNCNFPLLFLTIAF